MTLRDHWASLPTCGSIAESSLHLSQGGGDSGVSGGISLCTKLSVSQGGGDWGVAGTLEEVVFLDTVDNIEASLVIGSPASP